MPVLLSSPEPTRPVKPPTPPAPLPEITPWRVEDHFPGIESITWTGWDASTWELYCRNPHTMSGVALGRRLRGLHFPDIDEYASESPAVDGGAYQGYRVKPREVFLTLRVFKHTSSQEWIEHDHAFWRSMLPVLPGVRSPGRLTFTQPNGTRRWLELHPRHTGDHEYDIDPSRRGWCVYGQTLTAYQPFWLGDPLPARTFAAGGESGFFGGKTGGSGPTFVIGKAAQLGSASIDNPGDEPAWPVWRLNGPFTSAKIGTPGQMAEIVADIPPGESLLVDSDPLVQTVTDSSGAPRMPTSLTGAPFAPVPPGRNVPLVAEMVGTGNITVTLQPRYHRAW